ncbi:MAG TPA: hypothetical protein VK836_11010, partial [Streptosporangiaceae bacterium]|nr:hypothetical protein [Streptosporangiaceae bacterium]
MVVGDGVVEVAAGGGAAAAGVGAAALPDLDEVADQVGRDVPGGVAGVAAAAGLQELEAAAQAGGPPDHWFSSARAARAAGVAGRAAIGAGEGEAPAGAAVAAEEGGELAAGGGVDGAVAGDLARLPAAEERREGHGQVDAARH